MFLTPAITIPLFEREMLLQEKGFETSQNRCMGIKSLPLPDYVVILIRNFIKSLAEVFFAPAPAGSAAGSAAPG